MKRYCLIGLVVVLVWSLVVPCAADPKRLSWFCKHEKDHLQPKIDLSISFVEQYGAVYLDRRYQNITDENKVIYLTFDVGYENGNVEKILDVLEAESVQASFFILGHLIKKNSDLVRRMADDGHLLCNHTLRHLDMSNLSDEKMMEELHALERLCEETTGVQVAKFYRPPEGVFSRDNLICAQNNGYKTIFWSFAYPDWDNKKQLSPEKAKQIILDNVHNGEIMLLHPTSQTNAEIMKDIVQALKLEGYRFARLDELP